MHRTILLSALPVTILSWVAVILWITKGYRQLFVIWAMIETPYVILMSRHYFKNVAYICPQCHTVFRPSFKEAFWAKHTPATRKLTCVSCGHYSFCVEVAGEEAH